MTALPLVGLLMLANPALGAERNMDASDPVSAAARFKGPAGWRRDTGSFGADHFVSYSSGTLRLRVQLFGGKGSRYASAQEFLAGPEAKGGDGKTPPALAVKAGTRSFRVYTRSATASLGPSGTGAAGMLRSVDESFSIVPSGKRFFVVSLTRTLEVPPEDPLDGTPLKAFLASFRPR